MNYENLSDRELDALVATTLGFDVPWMATSKDGCSALGPAPIDPDWTRDKAAEVARENGDDWIAAPIWPYSKRISHAFSVVEAMRERGNRVEIHGLGPNYQAGFWNKGFHSATDESLPRAICIAALRACA